MTETPKAQNEKAPAKADRAPERVAQAPVAASKADPATTHVTQAPTVGDPVIDDARFDRKASPGAGHVQRG